MSSIERHAQDLYSALQSGVPIAPIRDDINNDIALAYAIQEATVQLRLADGETIVGKKIGLTSPAVQKQLGVDQPDYGVLFSTMDFTGESGISSELLMQPKVEGELAFILGKDLDGDQITLDDVKDAIAEVAAAIEIVGSRIENWDIKISDTIADNASGSHFVLSPERKALEEVDTAKVKMRLSHNGKLASEGSGEACMGDPLNAALWLAQTMAKMGRPLLKGEILLSGALGPMVVVEPGDKVLLDIEGFPSIDFNFF